jgi:hypothetical protein
LILHDRFGDDVCKGQRNGTQPVGGPDWEEFRRQGECKAYKAGKKCREALLKKCPSKDRDAIQKGIERDDERMKIEKCN